MFAEERQLIGNNESQGRKLSPNVDYTVQNPLLGGNGALSAFLLGIWVIYT